MTPPTSGLVVVSPASLLTLPRPPVTHQSPEESTILCVCHSVDLKGSTLSLPNAKLLNEGMNEQIDVGILKAILEEDKNQ